MPYEGDTEPYRGIADRAGAGTHKNIYGSSNAAGTWYLILRIRSDRETIMARSARLSEYRQKEAS